MQEIKVKPLDIILEPEGRNTTPAITIGALRALEIFKKIEKKYLTRNTL